VGRTTRVSGGGCRVSLTARDRGDRNRRPSLSSLVDVDRLATIASGEIYPELGISQRCRVTRSVVDKSSFPIPGNGMPSNRILRRRGVDPPKNESGSTGAFKSCDVRHRFARAGNGFIATDVFSIEFGAPQISIPHTRFCCLSAATRFVTPRIGDFLTWLE
jgi:hypothetical protein